MSELPAPDDPAAAEIISQATGLNAAIAGITVRDVQTMTFLAPTRVGQGRRGARPSRARAVGRADPDPGADLDRRRWLLFRRFGGDRRGRHADDRGNGPARPGGDLVQAAAGAATGAQYARRSQPRRRRLRPVGFRRRVSPACRSTSCSAAPATRFRPTPARCAATTSPAVSTTPEAYGEFAAACKARGYPAFKLHTWMSPHGPDLDRDIAACAAVREAVGPEMRLMLDPHHDYTRKRRCAWGARLEKLDYYWMEEPMDEHSTSSYVWLTEQPRPADLRAGDRPRARCTPAPSGSCAAPPTSPASVSSMSAGSPRR